MYKVSKHFMSIVLVWMAFQFVAPAFLEILVAENEKHEELTFHEQHSSTVAPLLLKEKENEEDEKENKKSICLGNLLTSLDIRTHQFGLNETHNHKFSFLSGIQRSFAEPLLFTLHHSLLI